MIDPTVLATIFRSTALQRPQDAVGFLLWRVAHRYQREIDRACLAVDLTHLQWVTLVLSAWLAREGATVMQSDLSNFGSIHPMQVSNVLKALEQKQLVVRPRTASDVRMKAVEITPAGLDILAQTLPLVEAAQRRFFGEDTAAGQELHNALRRIVASWEGEP